MLISEMPINMKAKSRGALRNPIEHSEFEVQAFLYCELARLGYFVRGELSAHGMKARFDLAIFSCSRDWAPSRIIEVKKKKRSLSGKTASGSQIAQYYADFGIPVDAVFGMKDAERYLEKIQLILPLPARQPATILEPADACSKMKRC